MQRNFGVLLTIENNMQRRCQGEREHVDLDEVMGKNG